MTEYVSTLTLLLALTPTVREQCIKRATLLMRWIGDKHNSGFEYHLRTVVEVAHARRMADLAYKSARVQQSMSIARRAVKRDNDWESVDNLLDT